MSVGRSIQSRVMKNDKFLIKCLLYIEFDSIRAQLEGQVERRESVLRRLRVPTPMSNDLHPASSPQSEPAGPVSPYRVPLMRWLGGFTAGRPVRRTGRPRLSVEMVASSILGIPTASSTVAHASTAHIAVDERPPKSTRKANQPGRQINQEGDYFGPDWAGRDRPSGAKFLQA